MGEVIVFPDAVAVIGDGLRAGLGPGGAPVAGRVPVDRVIGAGALVVLRRVGGDQRTIVVEDATLTVEAYHDTPEQAQDLLQLALAVIRSLRGTVASGVPVYRVDPIGGPAFLPDPETDQPRYSATISVSLRGATQ